MKIFWFILIVFSPLFVQSVQSQIYINEFMAKNCSAVMQPENNNYCDWIELYNRNNESIDISGWFLSDNPNDPRKWQLPPRTWLIANSCKIFWADGLDSANHTNFKLDDKKEAILLYNSNLQLIDSVTYNIAIKDVSQGRSAENPEIWGYFYEPTPKKLNTGYISLSSERLAEVIFSSEGGFYDENITIQLNSNNIASIHYTLDGSLPTLNSPKYENALLLNKTTVVRAIASEPEKLPSIISTHTFFINEKFSLPVVSLSMEPEFLWDKKTGIYVEGENYEHNKWYTANFFNDWERLAHFEYYDKTGQKKVDIDAGVKIFGRSSRYLPQKSLAVFAREKYGKKGFGYKFFEHREFTNIKSIILRSSGNDWGNTMFIDAMTPVLLRGCMDIDYQEYTPSIMFLNGEYWGIHNIREKVNKNFLANNFNLDPDKVDIIKINDTSNGYVSVEGSVSEFNELCSFIETCDLSDSTQYNFFCSKVDVVELMNYFITEIYFANTDWPDSNYKLWRSRVPAGKWRWVVYDVDLTFNLQVNQYNKNILEHALTYIKEGMSEELFAVKLFRRLLDNSEFRNDFIQRFASHLNTTFLPERVVLKIDSLENLLKPEIARFAKKWGGHVQDSPPYRSSFSNETEWAKNVEYMREFAQLRPNFVRQHICNNFHVSGTFELKIKAENSEGGKIFINSVAVNTKNFTGIYFKDVPLKIEAIAASGYKFAGWKKIANEAIINITCQNDTKLVAVFEKL